MKIKVSEIFMSVQGEGRYTGHPALFLRLGGCKTNCGFCDTPQRNTFEELEMEELIRRLKSKIVGIKTKDAYLIITGGEPGEQYEEILELFHEPGFIKLVGVFNGIIIETNGENAKSYWVKLDKLLLSPIYKVSHKVVPSILYSFSPKNYTDIEDRIGKEVMKEYAWVEGKILVLEGDTVTTVANKIKIVRDVFHPAMMIYLQPVDNNKKSIDTIIKYLFSENSSFRERLCTQVHKFLNIQ